MSDINSWFVKAQKEEDGYQITSKGLLLLAFQMLCDGDESEVDKGKLIAFLYRVTDIAAQNGMKKDKLTAAISNAGEDGLVDALPVIEELHKYVGSIGIMNAFQSI